MGDGLSNGHSYRGIGSIAALEGIEEEQGDVAALHLHPGFCLQDAILLRLGCAASCQRLASRPGLHRDGARPASGCDREDRRTRPRPVARGHPCAGSCDGPARLAKHGRPNPAPSARWIDRPGLGRRYLRENLARRRAALWSLAGPQSAGAVRVADAPARDIRSSGNRGSQRVRIARRRRREGP
jgi:hypothetical protein